MSQSTERSRAIDRCRSAFLANRIPWHKELEVLPNYRLHETAEYWEHRYRERDPDFDDKDPGCVLIGSTAGAIIDAHERLYHGARTNPD